MAGFASSRESAGHPESRRAVAAEVPQAQEQLHATVEALLRSLREGGILAVSDEDLPDLGQTIKMVVTCWIPFQIAQAPGTRITKPLLYQGLASAVPAAPYVRPQVATDPPAEQHYHQLAQPAG